MTRSLKSLLGFLTIIPVRGSLEEAADSFHWAPLVTGFREALTGLVLTASVVLGLPPMVSASLAFAAHLLLQGMHHFDGLLDAGEALIAARAGRDPLSIMRDRHRGGFAVGVGVAYGLLVWSLLAQLAGVGERLGTHLAGVLALVVAGAVSSAGMCAALHLLSPPPYQGLGLLFKKRLSRARVMEALALPSLITMGLILLVRLSTPSDVEPWFLEVLLIAGLGGGYLTTLVAVAIARRGIGYATGDVAGMVGELVFAGSLLASAVYLGVG